MVQFAFVIADVKAKAKTRWYYNRFPKPVVAGFTIGEILLTLTIIGVVAYLTIPTLLQSEQQAYYNSGVWTAYTMLSQAFEQMQANNGMIHAGIFDSGYGSLLRNDFCSVSQCVWIGNGQNIFEQNVYLYKSTLDPGWATILTIDSPNSMILNNGSYINIYDNNAACNLYGVNACGWIIVDINGTQGPNMWGEDINTFYFVLNNGVYSILPAGSTNDTLAGPGKSYSCQVGNPAWGCTYQRLYNPNNMP